MSVQLRPDFVVDVERSLQEADGARRKIQWLRRIRLSLPVALLAGPVIAWHLFAASPGGIHVVIGAIAWIAFLLDVGVHVNTTVLGALGLRALPTAVGALLLAMLSVSLLWRKK